MIYICPFCKKEVVDGNWDMVFADINPQRAHVECNRLSLMPTRPTKDAPDLGESSASDSESKPAPCG